MGPLTREEVRARISIGQLRLYDLLYFEGHDQWKMALEFPEFKDDFALSPHVPAAGKSWVLLHRKSPETREFITSGPFTQSEVIEQIKAGKVSYTDYIWRDGFKQWKRINSIDEFVKQPETETTDKSKKSVEKIMAASTDELLNKVVQMKRPPLPAAEEIPPEALGIETQKPNPPPLPAPAPPRTLEAGQFEEKRTQERRQKKNRRAQSFWAVLSWVDYSLVGLILVGLGFGGYYLTRPKAAENAPNPSVGISEVQEANLPAANEDPSIQTKAEVAPESPVVEKDETPPVVAEVPKVAEGLLQLKATVVGNKVEFSIRSGSTEPVLLQVFGLPGQILAQPTFYKYFRLMPQENGLISVDTSQLMLTAGQYLIRATRGDVIKEAKFSLGMASPDFKRQLNTTRKMVSQAIWLDRLTLLKIADQLEVYIAQKIRQPKGKVKLNDLSKLKGLKRSGGAPYLLFDYWWGMKEIFDKAQAEPSAALLEQLLQIRRKLAQFSIWK